MEKKFFMVCLVVGILLTRLAFAQDESIFKLQQSFIDQAGINASYNTADSNSPYNPATSPEIGDLGAKGNISTGFGTTNFSTGGIHFQYYGGAAEVPGAKGLFVSGYLYKTRGGFTFNREVPLSGCDLNATIDGTEICLGYKATPNLNIGVAIQKQEGNSYINFANNNLVSVHSASEGDCRYGAQYTAGKLKLGAVYATRDDKVDMDIYPALTGAPQNIKMSGTCQTRAWTYGANYNISPATSVFYNQKNTEYTLPSGTATNESCTYYGVQQYILPELSLKLAEYDNFPELTLNYLDQKGWSGSFYYRKGKSVPGFGPSDTYFFGVGKYF